MLYMPVALFALICGAVGFILGIITIIAIATVLSRKGD